VAPSPAPIVLPTAARQVTSELDQCFLLVDGTVYCRGQNSQGELGNGTLSDSDAPVKVALPEPATEVWSGESGAACAVLASRRVACWGGLNLNPMSAPPPPAYVPGVTDVDEIRDGVCAFRLGGAAQCVLTAGDVGWGYPPIPFSSVLDIVATKFGACVLTGEHKIYCVYGLQTPQNQGPPEGTYELVQDPRSAR